MADLDEEDYLLSLMDNVPPLRGKNLPAVDGPLPPMLPERNPAFHDVPDTVSEEESLLQMLDRDPAAHAAALSWGGQPSRPEPGGVAYGLASLAPVTGNAIAARDTYHAWDHLRAASKAGDIREQRKAALGLGMSFLGAISPFHFSGAAANAAKGASSRTNIFAGPVAKTADHAALERAYKLKEVGADRNHIWEETGWNVHNPDGPYFEIDDSAAKLANVTEKTKRGWFGGEKPTGEATFTSLDHPELAAAYGEVPSIHGRYGPGVADEGSYLADPSGVMPPYVHVAGPNPGRARSAAVHELQHHVSGLEGFTPGANVAQVGPKIYHRTADEVRARNAQTRLYFTPEQRRAIKPWETQDVPDELQIFNKSGKGPQQMTNGSVSDKMLADEQGNPLLVYHGTNRDFDQFQNKWTFASDQSVIANVFANKWGNSEGGRIIPLHVRAEKVKHINSGYESDDEMWEIAKKAQEDGYDAAVFHQPGGGRTFWSDEPIPPHKEVVVFDPRNLIIRSDGKGP